MLVAHGLNLPRKTPPPRGRVPRPSSPADASRSPESSVSLAVRARYCSCSASPPPSGCYDTHKPCHPRHLSSVLTVSAISHGHQVAPKVDQRCTLTPQSFDRKRRRPHVSVRSPTG